MQRSLREWTRRERSEHGRVLYGAKDFTNRAVRRSLFVSSNQLSVVSTERAAVSARLSVWAPGYVGAGSHAPLSPRLKASLGGGRTNSANLALRFPHLNTEHTDADVSCSGPSPLGATRTLCFPPSSPSFLPPLLTSLLVLCP